MRTFWLFLSICAGALLPHPVAADHFILVRPVAINAQLDEKDLYTQGLLRLALDHADGDHTMDIVPMRSPQGRGLRSLADGTADFHVYASGYSAEREQELSMVYFPQTRGLLGYRFLVTRGDQSDPFDSTTTLETLRNGIVFGSGTTWPDTSILRAAGLTVITGGHEQLWEMLTRRRIMIFPRGMPEVLLELRTQKDIRPEPSFRILESIMIAYPLDIFFFTAPTDARRTDIITNGLRNAYESGAFMAYFLSNPYISAILAEFERNPRRIIRLENPEISDKVKAIPAKYWHHFN